jgi:tetratricopeptide (TPR) repeat protein
VATRWVGGATVAQLKKILDDGRAAVGGSGGSDPVGASFARGEKLYGARDFKGAAAAYQEALRLAPAGWPRYARTTESLLFALTKNDDCAGILAVAGDALSRLRATTTAISAAASGLDCALQLPETDPSRAEHVARFEKAAVELVADERLGAAADDRSGLYGSLVEARKQAKDEAGARRVAGEWARFLEGEAARAKSPDARTVFDSHRLSAYIEAGEPQRAIPMLEASERDFPRDYNPPARLAVAYKEMKEYDKALAASDRALARAYGPRTQGMLRTRADIQVAKGDTAAARATLEQAVRTAEALPPGQRSDRAIAALKKRLESMGKPGA